MSDERSAYQKQVEEKLKEYSAKLDEWKAKAQQAEAKVKGEYYAKIDKAQNQQNELRTRFAELKSAGDEAWEKAKDRVAATLDEVRKSLSQS